MTALALVHLLAAAAWLGAMGYSLLVVQPRAAAFFADATDGDDEFERFVATLAHRQRWPVLAALTTIGLTGVAGAVAGRPQPTPAVWIVAVALKSVCWAAALALFAHVSWHLWPRRVFALPAERPALRRRFRRVGLTLLSLAVAASALGVIASHARP